MTAPANKTALYWLSKTWASPIIAASLILLHYVGILSPIENVALRIVQPFQAFAYESTIQQRSAGDLKNMSHDDLVNECLQLQDTLQNAKVENAHLRSVTEEAKLLKEQIDFLQKRSFEARTAKVVTRSSEGLARSIVLNKGRQDGIEEGFPVITGDGIFVGKIESADDYTAIVQLVTSYDALTSGSIQNDENSPGVLRGSHNLGMEMGYIPQGHKTKVGDMVVTSGSDFAVPRGLILGEIEQINNSPGSVFQSAQVRPLFEPENTFIVSVIIP